ncbi:collagenase [Streptomyces sp. G45]|uniref:collagenase n=1 Tax=Streptomyces sp. G45 TaxID=3406627 RepID=UPI003C214428
MRRRFSPLLTAVLAACLGITLLVPAGRAQGADAPASAPRPGVAPRPATPAAVAAELAPDAGRVADPTVGIAQRPPRQATPDAAQRERITATARPGKAPRCSVDDFASKTGTALIQQIKSVDKTCVYTLFSQSGATARALFREPQMVTVANALRATAAKYPGDNSTSTLQLVLYLRAGYYVQYAYPGDVGAYGTALKRAVRPALDAFFAAPRAYDVNDGNGEILAESVTLIDSSGENARYLRVVKKLLTSYDSSYDRFYWMLSAVNNTYTVLFRGHYLPEFVSAVRSDPSVLTVLRDFAVAHGDLLGTDRSYLTSNAGRELGRFLQHADLAPTVRPLAKQLLDRSSLTGRTAALWIGVAEMTDAYDKANCSSYGTCDLQNRVRDAVLTVRHTCSPALKIVAQELTAAQLSATCSSLQRQDAYFHQVAKDSGPVADDHNTTLEVVAFDSADDYRTYAGIVYGIDTNNGGMYLEGDPSRVGNLPRFIAYEAADAQIWNLNHEYTHYLDGRYNMYGDFEQNMTTPTVMWVEGFAEYISYSYRGVPYDAAIEEAGKNTYKLSTLFDTTYENTDTNRTYRWGYLAVRYLLQYHPQDVAALLGHYRSGDWAAARDLLTRTIGTRYDADFADWLRRCHGGDCGTLPGATR